MTVGQSEKEIRGFCKAIADNFYSDVKNNLLKAARDQAKELLDIDLTDKDELMLESVYKIGFIDAMYLCIDRGDDEERESDE